MLEQGHREADGEPSVEWSPAALNQSVRRQATAVLEPLFQRYARHRKPISVDFRDLVAWLTYGERYTHLIHPYPAKLLVHIPHLFLNADMLTSKGNVILDPFCGSGTVLLESLLAGHKPIGADSNPLARLIARVKTYPLSPLRLKQATHQLLKRIGKCEASASCDVVNMDYWFFPHVVRQLSQISNAISSTRDERIRDFFNVSFSSCARRVSLADPRLSVPVKLRANRYGSNHPLRRKTRIRLNELKRKDVVQEFVKVLLTNQGRNEQLYEVLGDRTFEELPIYSDARCLSSCSEDDLGHLETGSVDIVITSPPYLGAQKYIRSSSLSLGWLGLCGQSELRTLEDQNIGREHFRKRDYRVFLPSGLASADQKLRRLYKKNPLRAHIAARYISEMRATFDEAKRVLKRNQHLILVAANNQVCGTEFSTQEYLQELLEHNGFQVTLQLVDSIRSRGLMTKRNRTAGLITREWVTVFRKD